ncbi:hypothetical protein THMIRHAS_12410 [Thiosulfatimonas sediminis]|uniref:AlpA family transcriptional regulator n=2 Tax=Thiosulfatimonas sediminis TaxID=2675054 RepID=A0A6F8PV35_9GAMM|nr:AlpA family transcriptional regulator [Thiosulfatimonas sediminis]BBP45868.1 hypothetical protein THMIRHAS_12410 [Thiosulfatimonas sediminis]
MSQAKIMRLKEVIEVTGLSRTTIYRKVKAGEFPQRKQLSARSVGWLESDVTAWINQCSTVGAA